MARNHLNKCTLLHSIHQLEISSLKNYQLQIVIFFANFNNVGKFFHQT